VWSDIDSDAVLTVDEMADLVTDEVQPLLGHLDEQFLQFSGLGFVTLGPCHCA